MKHLIDKNGQIVCNPEKCHLNGDKKGIVHIPLDPKDRFVYIAHPDNTITANLGNRFTYEVSYYEVEK